MDPMQTIFLQHIQEAKHRAFIRWKASGYGDKEAQAEFVRLFSIRVRPVSPL